MNILTLGTAQFGLEYGIKNHYQKMPALVAEEILNIAFENQIETLDTAQLYGDSEQVIGNYIKKYQLRSPKIISKIGDDKNIPASVETSLAKLNCKSLYGLLIHNFSLYHKNPLIWESLSELKSSKKVGKIGFSLYHTEDLELLFSNNIKFDIVQVPYSIFDRRFEKYFEKLHTNNIEINIRSVFLQGLFFLDPNSLNNHFDKIKDKLKILQSFSAETGLSISSLCLNFASSNPFIDKIVIGVDSPDDLLNNIRALSYRNEVSANLEILNKLTVSDLDILLPYLWKK